MPAFARYLIYLILAGGAFAVGRYVIPSAKGLQKDGDAVWQAEAQQQYWNQQLEEILLTQNGEVQKVARCATLLDRMELADFPAVLNGLKDDATLAPMVTAAWAEADPAGCFKFLAAYGGRTPQDSKLACVLIASWAAKDFRSAEASASRLRVPGVQPDPLRAVAVALLRQDLAKGIAYLKANNLVLPDEVMTEELQVTEKDAPRWKGMDTNARIEFLQSLDPSAWQEAGLEKLYAAWMSQSPQTILAEAQQTGRGMNLVPVAAEKWVAKEPEVAFRYFETEAQHQVKSTLGLALAKKLSATDPQQAWEFAQLHLAGGSRVSAKQWILTRVAAQDPMAAWAWLKDVPQEPWRTNVLVEIKKILTARDANEASRWLEEIPVSDRNLMRLMAPEPPPADELEPQKPQTP